MTDSVLCEEKYTSCGKRIGVLTLNQASTLNALSIDMIEALFKQLTQWKNNAEIVCVLLKGAGEKAFCAGGDIQALYKAVTSRPGEACNEAEYFFNKEYRLDYLIHSYPKPVVCWGNGIVLGGGMGLLSACSHVVVTEKTRAGMPEVTIGLFPDVGGSWFLNRMPEEIGLFLGLTGVLINADDCRYTGLAQYILSSERYEELELKMLGLSWSKSNCDAHEIVSLFLQDFSNDSELVIPKGNLNECQSDIQKLCSSDDDLTVIHAIASHTIDHPWLIKARDTLIAGSPLSARVIFRQLQQSKNYSLIEVFQSELLLVTNIVRYPEFAEGVRALLIDKDRKPKWQYPHAADIPVALLDQMFTEPLSGASWPLNPLADLA